MWLSGEVYFMIKTFDFIIYAKKDKELREKLLNALDTEFETEVCTDIHKILFKPSVKMVIIAPLSDNSPFRNKIPTTEVSFNTIKLMLSGNWSDVR